MIAYYDAPTGREAIVRIGRPDVAPLLILPPLFEEANRTRALLIAVMRRLAERGVASALPDLPGCNDSPFATVNARFEGWGAAVAAVADILRPRGVASLRGGALLDRFAGDLPRWRLAPESGARVLRDLVRSTATGSGTKAGVLEAEARDRPTRLAGSLIHPALYEALNGAVLGGTARVVRLTTDAGDADARIDGAPVWRRAEPGSDRVLLDGVVDDLLGWLG